MVLLTKLTSSVYSNLLFLLYLRVLRICFITRHPFSPVTLRTLGTSFVEASLDEAARNVFNIGSCFSRCPKSPLPCTLPWRKYCTNRTAWCNRICTCITNTRFSYHFRRIPLNYEIVDVIYEWLISPGCQRNLRVVSFRESPPTEERRNIFDFSERRLPRHGVHLGLFERCVFQSSHSLRKDNVGLSSQNTRFLRILKSEQISRFLHFHIKVHVEAHILQQFITTAEESGDRVLEFGERFPISFWQRDSVRHAILAVHSFKVSTSLSKMIR